MLERLEVHDIALIAEAGIELSPHLTVLSGETGAGKTALFSALRLLAGKRADTAMIRDGAGSARVAACFTHDGRRLDVERVINVGGRGRCAVDGEKVTVAELESRIGPLLDLHGQHENQTLLQTESHVRYLDAWAGEGVASAREAYEMAFDAFSETRRSFEAIRRAAAASNADRESARLFLEEFERVDPQQGEYEQLEAQLPLLEGADALAGAADGALTSLRREGGADDALSEAHAALDRASGVDPALDELASRLGELVELAEDLASDLRAYRDGVDFDPASLERCQERLARLDGLCRRFGPRMSDVLDRAQASRDLLDLADHASERLEEASARLDAADEALVEAAETLARARASAADGFSQALTEAVAQLAMRGASFLVAASDLPRSAWTREGSQHVELLYSPGTGVAPRPLAKIASGGELSRVMLALVSRVDFTGADTLVFDEVDAGIGGATANLVADRLVDLAREHQVVVVTHLPQIAVRADEHLLVSKQTDADGRPATTVRRLSDDERVTEIARMLSGTDAEVSREHARVLLEQAERAG